MESSPDARSQLLARVVTEAARNGLADRSLRDLAVAVGTSHRMLLYHFGSREGLVAEVVAAVEAAQRDALAALAGDAGQGGGPSDVMRAMWAQVSDPSLRAFVQLFFEAVVYASRSGQPADFTGAWMADSAAASSVLGVAFDPIAVRLGIAVTRGLLIDVITGTQADADAARDALELFIRLWEAHSAPG